MRRVSSCIALLAFAAYVAFAQSTNGKRLFGYDSLRCKSDSSGGKLVFPAYRWKRRRVRGERCGFRAYQRSIRTGTTDAASSGRRP
jgi:hypothetical protein